MSITVQQYEVLVNWSEKDGHYIAQTPALPGCISDGYTFAEAVKNIDEVIKLWLETAREFKRDIPKPYLNG